MFNNIKCNCKLIRSTVFGSTVNEKKKAKMLRYKRNKIINFAVVHQTGSYHSVIDYLSITAHPAVFYFLLLVVENRKIPAVKALHRRYKTIEYMMHLLSIRKFFRLCSVTDAYTPRRK